MSYYDWEIIFATKTEKELFSIYSGRAALGFEAEIYAGSELLKRGYDTKKILDLADKKANANRISFMEAARPGRIKDNETFLDKYFWFILIPFTIILIITSIRTVINEEADPSLPIFISILLAWLVINRRFSFRKFRLEQQSEIININRKMDLLNRKIYQQLETAPNKIKFKTELSPKKDSKKN